MSKRLVHIWPYKKLLDLIFKAIKYWKKNEHIHDSGKFNLIIYPYSKFNDKKYKTYSYFTDEEHIRGSKLMENLGISHKKKWICVHNRDPLFLEKTQPKSLYPKNWDWSYHNYRNFPVSTLRLASEYFAQKGYFVLRMGSVVEEKFSCNNEKIIDYSNSSCRSDFLDVYLLAHCAAYLGSDSGIYTVPLVFKKPIFFVNFSPILIHVNTWFNPYVFIFQRMKNTQTGKLLSLRDILSKFSYNPDARLFKQHNVDLVNNSPEEIKSTAIDLEKHLKGEAIITNTEDQKIQDEFWKIYFSLADKKKIFPFRPKVSPFFLRNNLDLLD